MKGQYIELKGFLGKGEKAQLNGVAYRAFPATMLKEGVHNDLFYPAEELAKFPEAWNGRPVVIYHPKSEDGEPLSANARPEMIETHVGIIHDSGFMDDALKANVYVREEIITPALQKHINDGLEISTGLWAELDEKGGKWHDEEYEGILVNYRPDHLALLPGETGACSWEDGCGLRANIFQVNNRDKAVDSIGPVMLEKLTGNKLSHEDVGLKLVDSIRSTYGEKTYVYLEEVYDDEVVCSVEEGPSLQYYKQSYAIGDGDKVVLGDDKQEVRRQVVWKPVIQANKQTGEGNMGEGNKDTKPCCPERVEALIKTNAGYTEDDREWLVTLSEAALARIESLAKESIEAKKKAEAKKKEAPKTLEAYIEAAPEEMREVLTESKRLHDNRKREAIQKIVGNKKNTFTEDELQGMSMQELEKIEALAQEGDYSVRTNASPKPQTNEDEEEVLELPGEGKKEDK